MGFLTHGTHVRSLTCVRADVTLEGASVRPGNATRQTLEWLHSWKRRGKEKNKLYCCIFTNRKSRLLLRSSLTLVVVDVASVLSELSELPATLLTLPLQVLLHPAFLPVRGLFHMPPEQSLLKKLLPTDVTPEETRNTPSTRRFTQRRPGFHKNTTVTSAPSTCTQTFLKHPFHGFGL